MYRVMSANVGFGAVALPLARMRTEELLGLVEPFSATPGERLRELVRVATRRSLGRGAVVARQGAPADGLSVILRGRVHLTRTMPGPRALIVTTLGPGDTFGEHCVCKGEPASADAVCATPTETLHLPALSLTGYLLREPGALLRLMTLQYRRLQEVEAVAGQLALCDVGERTAYALVRLAARQGRRGPTGDWLLAPAPTRVELARMVGTCRETVSRALTGLIRDGLVRGSRRRMIITAALAARLEH